MTLSPNHNEFNSDLDENAIATTPEGSELIPWADRGNVYEFSITNMAWINENFPAHRHLPGSGAIEFDCPYHESHCDKERGLTCYGADSHNYNPFKINCSDPACREKLSLDFLGKLKKNKSITKLPEGDDPEHQKAIERLHSESPPDDRYYAAWAIEEAELDKLDHKKALGKMKERLGPDCDDDDLAEIFEKAHEKFGTKKTAKTKTPLEKAIADLDPEDPEAVRMGIYQMIHKAQVAGGTLKTLLRKINKNAGINDLKAVTTEYHDATGGDRSGDGEAATVDGIDIFRYFGSYHYDQAENAVRSVVIKENIDQGKPVFSVMDRVATRMHEDKITKRVTFEKMTADSMWAETDSRLKFVLSSKNGDGDREKVPESLAKKVHLTAYKYLPPTPEVIYTPVIVKGGIVISEPGYYGPSLDGSASKENDPTADLNLFLADTGFQIEPVNPEPSDEERDIALNWLRTEVLSDFPFMDHDDDGKECREPSEANALSMLMTPFMRRMIDGVTPVFFISKPQPGTGGTLLGKVPLILCDGEESAPIRYSQSEEEMNKGLIAAIMETRSHLFFDDVKDFNNRELLRAITSRHVGGRILGASKTVSVFNNFGWIGTGNNPEIKSEMERRIVWIRLNAKSADIQKRKFKHESFEKFLLDNRAIAVHHILTLIKYWVSKGMVPFTERKRASFEDWSAKVGGVLQACGVKGFLDNKRSAGQDPDESAVKAFVRDWLKLYGVNFMMTPKKAFEWAMTHEMEIIDGANDDQKKARFHRKMPTLDGRTFAIDGEDYMMRSGMNKEDDLEYYLVRLPKEEVTTDA